ncbi:hemerythrin domain-containing protein [Candidatus Symbiobacter mobilis]|uniref:Hemerythrin HHE cation binding protein n=1 Tax=Candidatus Symbiobacter mobilis CR TaxID=946483 RepID=U5NBG8_9BURK|nr:hemerythrin domain-containing protein [Candidatus Symbiobacter mobilis]AGX88665.1 hemerythrin HHE cation binding protein [Candidatus Symbiobacter mobilis CR]
MHSVAPLQPFEALDACHVQIARHLAALHDLLDHFDDIQNDPVCRQQVANIEAFFSGVSRAHHAEEERSVFPTLLTSESAELVHAVRTLQQDHGWIEQNWLELAPMLRGIARDEDWPDLEQLRHYVEVFVTLCHDHITLEEALIYPEAKSRIGEELARRKARAG